MKSLIEKETQMKSLLERSTQMTSRGVKPMLALLVALVTGLGFAATTIAAPPAGLQWEVHGTGGGSASLIAVTSSGPAMPMYIGNATYSLNLANPGTIGANGAPGGVCEFITGTGSIVAADGSGIAFATAGLLCNEAGAGSPLHYNGTYRITGGNGRLTGVAGGGSLTATFNGTHFFKIDGTITGI
jgi:hypothetical protein